MTIELALTAMASSYLTGVLLVPWLQWGNNQWRWTRRDILLAVLWPLLLPPLSFVKWAMEQPNIAREVHRRGLDYWNRR